MLLRLDNKPRTHDYRKSMWGHTLHGPEIKPDRRTFWEWLTRREPGAYLTASGHGDVRQGDFILVAMKSGSTTKWEVVDIEHYRNPDDMFNIRRATFVGFVEDGEDGK